jgi:hypothetical protein
LSLLRKAVNCDCKTFYRIGLRPGHRNERIYGCLDNGPLSIIVADFNKASERDKDAAGYREHPFHNSCQALANLIKLFGIINAAIGVLTQVCTWVMPLGV